MSVTPFGIIGALARSIEPGFGHWPAIAGVAKADAAATAMAAVASLVVRLNIAVSLKRQNLLRRGRPDCRMRGMFLSSRAPSAEEPAFATHHQNAGASRGAEIIRPHGLHARNACPQTAADTHPDCTPDKGVQAWTCRSRNNPILRSR